MLFSSYYNGIICLARWIKDWRINASGIICGDHHTNVRGETTILEHREGKEKSFLIRVENEAAIVDKVLLIQIWQMTLCKRLGWHMLVQGEQRNLYLELIKWEMVPTIWMREWRSKEAGSSSEGQLTSKRQAMV